ncbi:hypothetical protein JHK85_007674 [Glycine max]|nr:hypothetical protein JHK87_007290 [Glycine soja]KAG5055164.1 hypothetical protein JHK85_007674 [Glycine max]
MFPNNYDISSVQPIVAASEGTTVFGDQRNVREEPRKFDKEVNAARAHDLVALKRGGSSAKTNFPESHYKTALEAMSTDMTQTDVVDSVRIDSSTAKWEAIFVTSSDDNKSLGLFDTEEEAARAYDVESIRLKGYDAITNFNIRFYNVEAILKGVTDPEKVIYQSQDTVPVEAMQPLEVLQNIIDQGSSKMLYGTTTDTFGSNVFQRPISGNTEEQENYVAFASQGRENDPNRNLSLVTEGQPLVYGRSGEDDGQGGSSASSMCFEDELTNAYKKFIKRS